MSRELATVLFLMLSAASAALWLLQFARRVCPGCNTP